MSGAFHSTEFGQGRLVRPLNMEEVVDTTATGDTFVGHFSVTLATYLSANEGNLDGFDGSAIMRVNRKSTRCMQRAGEMQSMPWGYE
jgi:sugar/nucleoside kinase (ribokinase family)